MQMNSCAPLVNLRGSGEGRNISLDVIGCMQYLYVFFFLLTSVFQVCCLNSCPVIIIIAIRIKACLNYRTIQRGK